MTVLFDSDWFKTWMQNSIDNTERMLEQELPSDSLAPSKLHSAMRYAVLGGGKRVRACLVYAGGMSILGNGAYNKDQTRALALCASAVELIHAYSLVHDDLPCMDDDTLRRGKPTVHVKYDEATAMLVGDALQPLAFSLLAKMPISAQQIVDAIQVLSKAAGSLGMVGGQAIDCDSVGHDLSYDELSNMHKLKTGALLEASLLLGGIVAGAQEQQLNSLLKSAQALGLAFQVVDDILDVTADTATLGKTAGKDAANNKPTYVSLLGLEESKAMVNQLVQQSNLALQPFGNDAQAIHGIIDFIAKRNS